MASGSVGREEELPPALPVKQHRTHSFSRSSLDSDCSMVSPVGLQLNYAYADVFLEATDCHAAQCPIHQRYDPTRHEERFFSDSAPPPVPKKKLARTLSLPGPNTPPHSTWAPLSPQQRHPQNFDNPLYMLAPISDACFHHETEDVIPERSPVSHLPFSQLSFDTPDEHLPYLFNTFDDQRVVSQGIQHRHLLFLRSMAQSMEARILLRGEATERDVNICKPQDFLLNEGSWPKQVGDAVFYSLHSPKFPGREFGLRVHRQNDEAPSTNTRDKTVHVNVQNTVAHFQPNSFQRNDSVALQTQDPYNPFKSHCNVAKPPGGGSTECTTDSSKINLNSAQYLLQKGHSVSVERDLPHATLKDFVEDSTSLQSSECVFYDRQVCVLVLQILQGSQHLYNISAAAAELRPQEIFLVWPSRGRDEGPLERRSKTSRLKEETEWEMIVTKGIQMLWKMQGSPRVVLKPQSSSKVTPQSLTSIKSQIGAIIQYCLAPQETLDSSQSLKSSYRRGLLHFSSLLKSGSSGNKIADMVATLQVLLWGPRALLFNHRRSITTAVHNWLTIKRALLVMKLAERGLIQDQSPLDWEDYLCLQYLSFTDSETVVNVTNQLWLTLKMD